MTTEIKLEAAPVQWWNAYGVFVLCPFCDNIHYHWFDGDYNQDHSALAPCDPLRNGILRDQRYEFKFPFGWPNFAYEIDKVNMRFVAGGARLPVSDDQEKAFRERLRNEIDRKPKWSDATECDTFLRKKINRAVTALVMGNVAYVERYLNTSKETVIFLQGVEAGESHPGNDIGAGVEGNALPSGRTALHLAAREKSPRMVELLLSRGADANAADLHGRTPLMDAALWGQLENVEMLLKYGADKNRTRIEANQEIRAVNLAKRTQKNADRRRCGGWWVRKENTYARDLDRREIVRLLNDATKEPNLPQLQPCGSDGLSLLLTSPYAVPDDQKTAAILVRGGGLANIYAMSGRSNSGGESIQVANRDWSDEVRSLYRLIRFWPDHSDCHAEKQLIAWFVHKHLFLKAELDFSEQVRRRILIWRQLSREGLTVDHRERFRRMVEELDRGLDYKMGLMKLCRTAPKASVERALIVVSGQVCSCCWRFAAHVNLALGLDLQFHHRCMDRLCRQCVY